MAGECHKLVMMEMLDEQHLNLLAPDVAGATVKLRAVRILVIEWLN
jgi:hypothetical protein